MQVHKENDFFKKLSILALIIFGMILLFAVINIKPYVSGDGIEYLLQTEAISNHLTTDIRGEDFDSSYISFSDYSTELQYAKENYGGFHIAQNGKTFCAHFGGYALTVLPVKLILKIFNLNELRSFQITNALLYMISLLIVYFKLKISNKNKLLLLMLLMINPALYYITWTHTEVFSFSLVVISLVYFYNKNYKKSILFISLAAMQNPAIIMFGAILGIDYFINLYKKEVENKDNEGKIIFWKFVKDNFIDFIKTGICYLPFFLPIIQTYINFNKFNLVASVARQSDYMLEKTIGYLFDLNLGIIAYVPIVLILFFIFLIIGLRKNTSDTFLQALGLLGIFYIISNQLQINSGMNGIMRYNVWIIPIMIFFIVMKKDTFGFMKKTINKLLICSTLVTLIVFLVSGGFLCSNFNCQQFSPWAKVILNYIPSAYNPYHGIFITRTTQREQYDINYPLIYEDEKGYARKILVPENTTSVFDRMIIRGSDEDVNYLRDEIINVSNKKGYQYINLNHNKKLMIYNAMDVFDPNLDNMDYGSLNGVSSSQGDYCWIGPYAKFAISGDSIEKDILIKFDVNNLLKQYNMEKDIVVNIKINDTLINTLSIKDFDKEYNIIIPKTEIPSIESGGFIFEFITNAYFNPAEEGMSNDNRDLSISLKYVGNSLE